MRRTGKNKKQTKTKKIQNKDAAHEQEEDKNDNFPLVDTALPAKPNSLIVSSLYLFSISVITLALAVIVGLLIYVYSYNFEKSGERLDFRIEDFQKSISSQEEADIHENEEYIILDDDLQLRENDPHDPQEKDTTAQESPEDSDERPSKEKETDLYIKAYINLEHRDLFHSYTFDFEKALKLRQEAMKKYSYPYSTDTVDKRRNLSLQEFYDVYDGKWPVIVTDVIPTWPASNWSVDFFNKKYGHARVAMVALNIAGGAKANTAEEKEGFSVPLDIFIQHLNVSNENMWTYVQDEVFLIQFPELRDHVLNTIYTKEDYFKLFPKEIRPWDCLFLWGTAHSRSTLHIDPYNWTGTNAVISGRKRWKLLPPGQDKHLGVNPNGACGFPLDCQKYNSKYDTYSKSDQIKHKLKKLQYLEVDQLSGEMLFLPTGWFHQAYNVEPTLAVSGEVMNRNNYLIVLEEILKVGNLPRTSLPQNPEVLSPEQLVSFIMSQMPPKIIRKGEEWTKLAIKNLFRSMELAREDEEKILS